MPTDDGAHAPHGPKVTKRLMRAHLIYGHRVEVGAFESADDLAKRHDAMHTKGAGHVH